MSQVKPAQALDIELRAWDERDNPIAWSWLNAEWDSISDDFFPRDPESYFIIRERQGAINFGVWRGDEVGGLI